MIKKTILATIVGVLGAAGMAAPAFANDWYGRVEGGGTFSGGYDIDGVGDVDQNDMGWRAGGALGTNLTPNLRAEGELSYSSGELDGGADMNATIGMANLYYDFAPGAAFSPFLGGGVGAGKFEAGAADDTGFAYQLTGGVATQISPNVTGELAYKYTGAPDLDIGPGADFQGSAITAGVRFKLGG